jgi:hypothetical protein
MPEITTAHTPHVEYDNLDDLRNDIRNADTDELRTLALQMAEDLEAAYLRIAVAYDRMQVWEQESRVPAAFRAAVVAASEQKTKG